MERVGGEATSPRRSTKRRRPEVWYAAISIVLGALGGLAFKIAGVPSDISIVGGLGAGIAVALLQLRHAIYVNWEDIHGVARDKEDAVRRILSEEMGRLTRDIQAFSLVRSEVLSGEQDTLQRARDFQRGAKARIRAMWTVMRYSTVLRDYLEETVSEMLDTPGGPQLIERIVDIENPQEDIVDHLKRTWKYIQEERYVARFASRIELEILLVDGLEAALFLQPAVGYDCVHLSGGDPAFVNVVNGAFDQVWDRAKIVPKALLKGTFDEAALRDWLSTVTDT